MAITPEQVSKLARLFERCATLRRQRNALPADWEGGFNISIVSVTPFFYRVTREQVILAIDLELNRVEADIRANGGTVP